MLKTGFEAKNQSHNDFPDRLMLTIVTNSLKGSAIFDVSRRYRYCLTRSWVTNDQKPHQITFIMLNPSTANAERDDPTIRACSQFAQTWGYNQLEVVNLFAYRTHQPSALSQASNPIGPENDSYLLASTRTAEAEEAGEAGFPFSPLLGVAAAARVT